MAACFLALGMCTTTDEAVGLMKGIRPKVNLSKLQRLSLEQWFEAHNRSGRMHKAVAMVAAAKPTTELHKE